MKHLARGGALLVLLAGTGTAALADAATCHGTAVVRDLATEACGALRASLPGRRVGDAVIDKVVDCDAPVLSLPSALGGAAAVAADLAVDGPPSHGAFLFERCANGWQLRDDLLEPAWTHGGHCETRFSMRWRGAAAAARLDVMAERTCHLPLDRAEVAAGTSSVASRECRTLRYTRGGSGLQRVGDNTEARRCRFK